MHTTSNWEIFKHRNSKTLDYGDSKEPWLYTWPTHVKFLKKEEDSYIKRGSIALGVFCKTKTVLTHARKIYVDHITSHAYANSYKLKKNVMPQTSTNASIQRKSI